MRGNLIAPFLIGGLVVATVVFGLIVTGGPEAGRMEKRDQVRIADLQKLNEYVRCLADKADRGLPEELTEDEACSHAYGQVRLVDPYSGTAYRYERISDKRFQLCAGFERPDSLAGQSFGHVDAASGCLTNLYYSR